jgi:hypothetical protein
VIKKFVFNYFGEEINFYYYYLLLLYFFGLVNFFPIQELVYWRLGCDRMVCDRIVVGGMVLWYESKIIFWVLKKIQREKIININVLGDQKKCYYIFVLIIIWRCILYKTAINLYTYQ